MLGAVSRQLLHGYAYLALYLPVHRTFSDLVLDAGDGRQISILKINYEENGPAVLGLLQNLISPKLDAEPLTLEFKKSCHGAHKKSREIGDGGGKTALSRQRVSRR